MSKTTRKNKKGEITTEKYSSTARKYTKKPLKMVTFKNHYPNKKTLWEVTYDGKDTDYKDFLLWMTQQKIKQQTYYFTPRKKVWMKYKTFKIIEGNEKLVYVNGESLHIKHFITTSLHDTPTITIYKDFSNQNRSLYKVDASIINKYDISPVHKRWFCFITGDDYYIDASHLKFERVIIGVTEEIIEEPYIPDHVRDKPKYDDWYERINNKKLVQSSDLQLKEFKNHINQYL